MYAKSIILIALNQMPKMLWIFVIPIIVSRIPPTDFAELVNFIATSSIIGTIIGLRLDVAITNKKSVKAGSALFSSAIITAIIIGVSLGIAMYIVTHSGGRTILLILGSLSFHANIAVIYFYSRFGDLRSYFLIRLMQFVCFASVLIVVIFRLIDMQIEMLFIALYGPVYIYSILLVLKKSIVNREKLRNVYRITRKHVSHIMHSVPEAAASVTAAQLPIIIVLKYTTGEIQFLVALAHQILLSTAAASAQAVAALTMRITAVPTKKIALYDLIQKHAMEAMIAISAIAFLFTLVSTQIFSHELYSIIKSNIMFVLMLYCFIGSFFIYSSLSIIFYIERMSYLVMRIAFQGLVIRVLPLLVVVYSDMAIASTFAATGAIFYTYASMRLRNQIGAIASAGGRDKQ
jgi:hypothetical protein